MKKLDVLKRSVVGVCAATLLTGLCAAPAFAVGSVSSGSPESVESGNAASAKTAINVQAVAAQISVTVPTAVSASVVSSGELTFPDSNAFTIIATNADWPVRVTGVKVEVAQGYSLKEAPVAAKDLSLKLNDMFLIEGSNTLTKMTTTAGSTTAIGVTMTGSLFNPSYSEVSSPINLVNLTWTVSA